MYRCSNDVQTKDVCSEDCHRQNSRSNQKLYTNGCSEPVGKKSTHSTESGIALLSLHGYLTGAQEKPEPLVFWTERSLAIALTLTVSRKAVNIIAVLLLFFFPVFVFFLNGSTCSQLPLIDKVSGMRWCLYGKCCKNSSIVQNKLQTKHICKKKKYN